MSTPASPLEFKPADPVTAAAIREHLKKTEPPPGVEAPPAEPAPEQSLVFDSTTEFDNPNQAMVMSSGFVDTRLMEVTDEEKFAYIKCLGAAGAEQPFQLPITLFGGALKLSIRTRTMAEQQRINDLIGHEFGANLKTVTPADVALCAKRTNQYLMMVMIRSVGGVSFGGPDICVGTLAEAHAAALDFATRVLEPMSVPRMTAFTNAIRIFESKAARCATEAANGSFWEPRS